MFELYGSSCHFLFKLLTKSDSDVGGIVGEDDWVSLEKKNRQNLFSSNFDGQIFLFYQLCNSHLEKRVKRKTLIS